MRDEPSAHLRIRPRFIQGLLIDFIRFHFSNAENIEDPILDSIVWTSNPETTKLFSEPELVWQAKEASRIPAILVSKGSIGPDSQFLNDRLSGGYGQEKFEENGKETTVFTGGEFMRQLNGAHQIYIKAKTDGEVAALSEEIWYHLLEFQEPIQAELNLNLFTVGQLEEPKILREEGDHHSVHFSIFWSVWYGWKINRESPVLKKFSFSRSTTGPPDTGIHQPC